MFPIQTCALLFASFKNALKVRIWRYYNLFLTSFPLSFFSFTGLTTPNSGTLAVKTLVALTGPEDVDITDSDDSTASLDTDGYAASDATVWFFRLVLTETFPDPEFPKKFEKLVLSESDAFDNSTSSDSRIGSASVRDSADWLVCNELTVKSDFLATWDGRPLKMISRYQNDVKLNPNLLILLFPSPAIAKRCESTRELHYWLLAGNAIAIPSSENYLQR